MVAHLLGYLAEALAALELVSLAVLQPPRAAHFVFPEMQCPGECSKEMGEMGWGICSPLCWGKKSPREDRSKGVSGSTPFIPWVRSELWSQLVTLQKLLCAKVPPWLRTLSVG